MKRYRVVGYVIACAVWPYRRCGHCEGTGKRRSPSGEGVAAVAALRGQGHAVRSGRHLAEWF
jgi:hypothetical protein